MKCNISCSFSEIIDKMTILKIKLSKATDLKIINNINKELTSIEAETQTQIPFHLSDVHEPLFVKLQEINQKLWDLEDMIREKSQRKQFDHTYIECAESIHKTNDLRYRVKNEINRRYNSDIIEEKLYSFITNYAFEIKEDHIKQLEDGKSYFNNGDFVSSFNMLLPLMKHYNTVDNTINNPSQFMMDLRMSFDIISEYFDVDIKLRERNNNELLRMNEIINKEPNEVVNNQFKEYWNLSFFMHCLRNKKYLINHHECFYNCVYGPGICPVEMSFFKDQDDESNIQKTLLVYNGGGIGDMIMFFRFIRLVCEKYLQHRVMVIVEDELIWMFSESHKDLNNLVLFPSSQKENSKSLVYDYHCNIYMLMKYLKLDYQDIPFVPYLKSSNRKIESKQSKKNKTVVFNWKGSSHFSHEYVNRRMELTNAIPLFKLPNVTWLVVTKEITCEETKILQDNNVKILSNDPTFDAGSNAFEQTLQVFNSVDYVVSTDTSLLHLSGTMEIPTIALLTKACEWRWCRKDTNTNWYPNMTLIKQTTQGDWNPVIKELCDILD